MSDWQPEQQLERLAEHLVVFHEDEADRLGHAGRRLFGRQKQRIVRLAAGLDVELQVGMALLDPLEQAVEVRLVGAGEERHHAAGLVEQALGDGGGDVVEVGAAGDRLAVGEAEPGAFATERRSSRRRARRSSPRRS